jgi:hypothetical protein
MAGEPQEAQMIALFKSLEKNYSGEDLDHWDAVPFRNSYPGRSQA